MATKKPRSRREAPREMAAVMFTDVRGYSSLSQRDEALAVRLLDVKQGLASPLIAKHHGRLIKTIGDALMVEFKSALAAVQCAVALQTRLHEYNATRPAAERLVVRIGVHVGDVIRKGGDLLGDTVNLAARVEPKADPGGIAVTQAVYDQIRAKLDLPLVTLGLFELKGMRDEVELFAVKLPWEAETTGSKTTGPGLITRLKQHHMFRVVSLYATVGWILILVANQVFPDIGLTREDGRYLIAAVALLFPVAVAVAWMFVPPSREDPDRYGRWKKVRFRSGVVFSLVALFAAVVSGLYLWRLDSRRTVPVTAQAIVVLPFEKVGAVDDATLTGMRDAIEASLSALGNVRVIPRSAYEVANVHPVFADIAKSTGASLFLQGSVQVTKAGGPYTIRVELVSAEGPETLYSNTDTFSGSAPVAALEQQVASLATGPVRFMTRGDDWLAKGYPTSKNPRAMQALRKALMSYFYGAGQQIELLHEAIDLDANFAQAHAYLAIFQYKEAKLNQPTPEADAEVAIADKLVHDLPETALARGYGLSHTDNVAATIEACSALKASLPNNFFMHYCLAWSYWDLRRWDDALSEFKANAALDPYQLRTSGLVARVGYAKRDFDQTADFLKEVEKRWPLYPSVHLWRMSLDFDYHGDLDRLAEGVTGDWSQYGVDAKTDWLLGRAIEVEHLQGKHVQVLDDLKAYPHDCSIGSLFGTLTHRLICVDSFSAESNRLLGRDKGATEIAAMALPRVMQEDDPDAREKIARIALLQVFSGQPEDAMHTIAPLLADLARPPANWDEELADRSVDAAVVLAWAGRKADAIALLGRSLSAVWGAQANALACDPVWRPLYGEAGFKALLAAHGATLRFTR